MYVVQIKYVAIYKFNFIIKYEYLCNISYLILPSLYAQKTVVNGPCNIVYFNYSITTVLIKFNFNSYLIFTDLVHKKIFFKTKICFK